MELTEVPTSIPDKGVSVKVAAAGVCRSDLHVLEGEMIPPPEGYILGHVVSGWVVDFGTRCENPHDLSPGDPVVVSWIITCGKCYWCARGQVNYCPYAAARMPGLIGLNGGHAKYMTVPETAVFPTPKGVDVHTVADISCAYDKRLIEPRVSMPRRRLCVIHTSPVSAGYLKLLPAAFDQLYQQLLYLQEGRLHCIYSFVSSILLFVSAVCTVRLFVKSSISC